MPVTHTEEVIRLLQSIDSSLRTLVARLAQSPSGAGEIAPDRDLDGKYGDEEIRSDPKRWDGARMKGRRMSECPPDYLDLLAEFLEWQAQQADKKNERTNGNRPVSEFRRQSAARARGWAMRIRAGQVQQAPRGAQPEQPLPAFAQGNEFEEVGDWTPNNWRS
jgi:hypothetical protein